MKAIQNAGLDLSLTGFELKEVDDIVSKVTKNLMETEPPMKDPAGPKVTKTKDADAGNPADPNYVSVSFHMSAENRDGVLKRLNAYKASHGYANVSAALIGMVAEAVPEE